MHTLNDVIKSSSTVVRLSVTGPAWYDRKRFASEEGSYLRLIDFRFTQL